MITTRAPKTLIRATEGTILDKPPRACKSAERRWASSSWSCMTTVQSPGEVLEAKERLPLCYDFELMFGSGHLQGRLVSEPALVNSVFSGLSALIEPSAYAEKYQLPADTPPLLFAMGDGNHSLATAKAIWEELKPTVGMDIPRYALVEIVNLHDPP